MFKLATTFVQSVMPGVIKPLHVLWNEVIGFLFLSIAIIASSNGWKYRDTAADPKNFARLALTAGFVLVMVWFGISSFLKARRIRRRGLTIIKAKT